MFRPMNDNDRSYHEGVSENAMILIDEDFPVVIVLDGSRIEVYWTDDELDTHNYSRLSYELQTLGIVIYMTINRWLTMKYDLSSIYDRLRKFLVDIGFNRV